MAFDRPKELLKPIKPRWIVLSFVLAIAVELLPLDATLANWLPAHGPPSSMRHTAMTNWLISSPPSTTRVCWPRLYITTWRWRDSSR